MERAVAARAAIAAATVRGGSITLELILRT
jgi:hypothetical protein